MDFQKNLDREAIEELRVKVLGGYVAPPEHLIFHVLEADDYASIVKFYRPIMTMGDAEITPVQTLEEAAGIFPAGDR